MASKFALTLVFTGFLFLAAGSVQAASDHDLVSPPRVNERPIDTGSEAPYVPITNAELLGQMEEATTGLNDYMIAASGNDTLVDVPAGSPPYR